MMESIAQQAAKDARDVFSDDRQAQAAIGYMEQLIYAALRNVEYDLSDPVAVHANMLRGTIAKPTVEQIIHLYGREAFQPMIDAAVAKALGKACLAVSEHADWPEDEHGRTEQVGLFAGVINAILAITPAALAPTDAARECCDLCGSDVTDMDGHLVHDEGCNGETYDPAAQVREAAAWQSTTEAFIPFVTDERYRRFSPEVQKHYIPYRCPSCVDAAQARETALKKAAQLAYEVWDDPEALAKAILALIGETRT